MRYGMTRSASKADAEEHFITLGGLSLSTAFILIQIRCRNETKIKLQWCKMKICPFFVSSPSIFPLHTVSITSHDVTLPSSSTSSCCCGRRRSSIRNADALIHHRLHRLEILQISAPHSGEEKKNQRIDEEVVVVYDLPGNVITGPDFPLKLAGDSAGSISFSFESLTPSSSSLCPRPGFQHRQHARQGAGSRGMFGKLSIAFVVLVICTLSFLFLSTLSSGGGESSSPSEVCRASFSARFFPPRTCWKRDGESTFIVHFVVWQFHFSS